MHICIKCHNDTNYYYLLFVYMYSCRSSTTTTCYLRRLHDSGGKKTTCGSWIENVVENLAR